MKKIFALFIIHHLSFSIFAQSGTLLPDGFIVPLSAIEPACTENDIGKIYYNTNAGGKGLRVCDGTKWNPAESPWNYTELFPNIITTNSFVGINNPNPNFELDLVGTIRASSNVFASRVSIGTTNTTSGLLVQDGDIAISSTADAKTWKFNYEDDNDRLAIQEDGTTRMVFANGGNVGIGSTNPTTKLHVDGNGSFSGNLTVNNGKGIIRTTTANSMKMHTVAHNLGVSFNVNAGNCATSNVPIASAGYTTAPMAYIGNFVSGSGNYGQLITQVQATSTTQVIVRFCNNTSSNITLTNAIYNILILGQ